MIAMSDADTAKPKDTLVDTPVTSEPVTTETPAEESSRSVEPISVAPVKAKSPPPRPSPISDTKDLPVTQEPKPAAAPAPKQTAAPAPEPVAAPAPEPAATPAPKPAAAPAPKPKVQTPEPTPSIVTPEPSSIPETNPITVKTDYTPQKTSSSSSKMASSSASSSSSKSKSRTSSSFTPFTPISRSGPRFEYLDTSCLLSDLSRDYRGTSPSVLENIATQSVAYSRALAPESYKPQLSTKSRRAIRDAEDLALTSPGLKHLLDVQYHFYLCVCTLQLLLLLFNSLRCRLLVLGSNICSGDLF